MEFDLLIRNGRVLDGTGNPWYQADVGISGDRIGRIGQIRSGSGKQEIDASGHVVCPGFIDVHSHSDFPILINPKAESKIRQGVTTEVIGNCGSSAAPLNDLLRDRVERTNPTLKEAGLAVDWQTMLEYLRKLKTNGIALNIAALVGHGNIRAMVLGFERHAPTVNELQRMREIAAQAIREGAVGMSTGLIYTPGSYAKTDEIVELAKAVKEAGGIYTSHIRGEGQTLFEAVKEAIGIGERAQIPVQISHHKAAGRTNWGKVGRSLRMIEQARKRGVDVTCDVYPYVASSFPMSAMLPPWVHESGPPAAIARLKSPEIRKKIRRDMVKGVPGWTSPLKDTGWNKTMIASCPIHREYQGLMMSKAARKARKDPFDFMFDLLVEENLAPSVVRFGLNEHDVRTVLSYRNTMIGSDGSSMAPYGPLGRGKPHPRSYGTFPRIIARYVRRAKLMSLEEAVRRMTSLPAQRFRLWQRGIVRVGMFADLCVFDPNNIEDTATFQQPHQFPRGINHVTVNGQLVIREGEHTGALPGRPLGFLQ